MNIIAKNSIFIELFQLARLSFSFDRRKIFNSILIILILPFYIRGSYGHNATKNTINDKEQIRINKKIHVPIIWNLPYNDQRFVGRQSYIKKVRGMLQSKNMATVVAMGGMGKSSVARQYANKFKGNYDIVVWINAQADINSQMESLAEQYVTFIDKTPQKGFQSYSLKRKLSYIRNKLRTKPHRFLLIFDNAQEYKQVKQHLVFCQNSKGVGHILVTTRSSVQWPYQLRLKMLATKEAQDLITQVTGSKDKGLVAKLAGQLKNYPLAIARAASYIKSSDSFDLASYIKAFESQRSELLQKTGAVKGLLNDYYRTSYTVLSLALNTIKQRSFEAWELLLCLSLLKNIDIPVDYIKEWVSKFAKDSVTENLLSVIQSQSILEKNGQFFNIHELTSEIIRKHIPKGRKKDYLEKSVKILLSIFEGRSDLVVARIIKERYHLTHGEEVLKQIKGKQNDTKAVIALRTALLECYDLGLKKKKRCLELIKDLDKYFGSEKTKWFGMLYEPSKVEAMFLNCKARLISITKGSRAAIEYREKSYNTFMQVNDPNQEKIRPIAGLILNAALSGDLVIAKKYIDIGEKYVQFCPSLLLRFSFNHSKLTYALFKGDKKLIEKALDKTLFYYPQLDKYPTSQMFQLALIIEAFYYLRKYKKMSQFLDVLEKKMNLFYGNEIPDFFPAAALKLYRGLYYINQGQKYYNQAEKLINQSIKILKVNHDLAVAYMAVGKIYLNLNRDKADRHKSYHSYKQAKKILDQVLKSKDNDYYSQLYCQMVKVGAINDHFGITVENYVKHIERFGGDHPRTLEMILYLDRYDKVLPK